MVKEDGNSGENYSGLSSSFGTGAAMSVNLGGLDSFSTGGGSANGVGNASSDYNPNNNANDGSDRKSIFGESKTDLKTATKRKVTIPQETITVPLI